MYGTVDHYATQIMADIEIDIKEGRMPKTVATFSELHNHVDANEYLLDRLPYQGEGDLTEGVDDPDAYDAYLTLTNKVMNEVNRRLGARNPARPVKPELNTVELADISGMIETALQSDGFFNRADANAHADYTALLEKINSMITW